MKASASGQPESSATRSPEKVRPLRRTVMQVICALAEGGSEVYALSVARNLDPCRFRSVLCALDFGGALEAEARQHAISCHVMGRRPGIDLALMMRMYRLFRRERVDVVHTHHFTQLFYSAVAARLAGARLIHTEHDAHQIGKRRIARTLRSLAPLFYRVLAIGDDVATALTEGVGLPTRQVEIVRAGVDIEEFTVPRQAAREALGLGHVERVATIVARLRPEKNHRLLLAAFALVAQRLDTARLLIVGDGEEREGITAEVERLGLQERVRMLGLRRDIPRVLAASDVFVLSSDREGLPIAVLEAMAAGLPVVSTNVGDLPQVIIEGQTGCLVAPGDASGLGQRLTGILVSPERAAHMGACGHRLVEEQFSTHSMVARLQTLYVASGHP